jgi:hypothetical protein
MDLVLTEGFKSGALPKIEVNRQAQQSPLLCGPADRLVAVAADWDTGAPVPHFGLEEIAALADFVEREYPAPGAGPAPELLVGGRRVALNVEAAQALARAVHDLVGDSLDLSDGPAIELRIPGRSGHLARP